MRGASQDCRIWRGGMNLKRMMEKDIKGVFLNAKEFGERHMVDGRKMYAIIDDNELVEREKMQREMAVGLHVKRKLMYVAAKDYGPAPLVDRVLELDGELYTVTDVADECGMYSVSLEERQP